MDHAIEEGQKEEENFKNEDGMIMNRRFIIKMSTVMIRMTVTMTRIRKRKRRKEREAYQH